MFYPENPFNCSNRKVKRFQSPKRKKINSKMYTTYIYLIVVKVFFDFFFLLLDCFLKSIVSTFAASGTEMIVSA